MDPKKVAEALARQQAVANEPVSVIQLEIFANDKVTLRHVKGMFSRTMWAGALARVLAEQSYNGLVDLLEGRAIQEAKAVQLVQ